jgi:fatty-acyl-CoA synthase
MEILDHPFATIGAALRAQAHARPDAPAILFPESGARLTYRDWWREAQRVAGGLCAMGVRPGDHVALLAQNRVEWPVVQAAVALCGAVLVPVNTHFLGDDLGYVLRHSRARVLILSNRFRSNDYLANVRRLRPQLPALEHVVVLDEPQEDALAWADLAGPAPDGERAGPEAVAALLYTSGTTGFPKGALLSHRAMLFCAWQVTRRLAIDGNDRWTSFIPLFHCAGCIMAMLGVLQRGACYVGVAAFDPVAMFRVIEQQRCTVLSGVPTSYLAMLEHPARGDFDLSSLRTGTCGGANAHADMLRACARDFPIPHLANVYGQTETATIVTCPAFDDPQRFDTVGPVLDACELRITHPATGAALAQGEIGQVETRGPMVMDGYFEAPEATAETLAADGWLRTGDLGYLTADGRLCIAGGRLRDLIIRGGENIYPAEVENRIVAHPAVSDAAVFAVPDRYYGEVPAAALVLAGQTTAAELDAHCRESLARFKVPARWYVVEAFPKTASGKIRKVALQQDAAEGTLTELP